MALKHDGPPWLNKLPELICYEDHIAELKRGLWTELLQQYSSAFIFDEEYKLLCGRIPNGRLVFEFLGSVILAASTNMHVLIENFQFYKDSQKFAVARNVFPNLVNSQPPNIYTDNRRLTDLLLYSLKQAGLVEIKKNWEPITERPAGKSQLDTFYDIVHKHQIPVNLLRFRVVTGSAMSFHAWFDGCVEALPIDKLKLKNLGD